MVAVAVLTGEKEIIFPEILALATGAWCAEKQPWKVTRCQIPLLMTLSACAGVLIVRYIPAHTSLRIVLGFLTAAVLLALSATSLVPVISACILPVLLGTTTWIYPLSVFLLCVVLSGGQWLMEKCGFRTPESPVSSPNSRFDYARWAVLCLVLFLLSLIPVYTGMLYLIAPPLIVAFAELSNSDSPAREHPVKIYLLLAAASCIGVFCRLVLSEIGGFPLWICAALAAAFIFLLFELLHLSFPPAAALALLPLLLTTEGLWWYPAQVFTGGALFLLLALTLFRKKCVAPVLQIPEGSDTV